MSLETEIEDFAEEVKARERGRLRGINYLEALLEDWNTMTDLDKKGEVATALNRLKEPF